MLASAAEDDETARDAVRDAVRFFVGAEAHTPLVGRSRHRDEIRDAVGADLVVGDAWIDEFAVVGAAHRVGARLQALLDAGADALGLWLFPGDQLEDQLERMAAVTADPVATRDP